MKIMLHDKVYDLLKALCTIVIPALCVLYDALAAVWKWGYAFEVSATVAAVCTFLGALIGISSAAWKKEQEEER